MYHVRTMLTNKAYHYPASWEGRVAATVLRRFHAQGNNKNHYIISHHDRSSTSRSAGSTDGIARTLVPVARACADWQRVIMDQLGVAEPTVFTRDAQARSGRDARRYIAYDKSHSSAIRRKCKAYDQLERVLSIPHTHTYTRSNQPTNIANISDFLECLYH